MKLNLETRVADTITILQCNGRFTYREEATAFSEKLAELLRRSRRIVLELSNLETIDSAGLGELVVVHMWARASGCSIKIAAPKQRVRELFELTHLASVLEIYHTLDEALLSFQQEGKAQRASSAA